MTACASPYAPAAAGGISRGTPLTVSACGGYAARLVTGGDGWYPERWTLDGPEPYAVPLPGGQPEDPESQVLPLADGRVLIARRAGDRYLLVLLYPSGPETGELLLGAVEAAGRQLTLLPPAPDGRRVYALVNEVAETGDADGSGGAEQGSAVWLVCGGAFGPELVCKVAGTCTGGAWLDRAGRLLVLNRTDAEGRVRAVTVDVECGGPPSVLLQIGEQSNDRLLLAEPDSGLLLVASDAPGVDRIGWGVLGSQLPVRFPEALGPAALSPDALARVSPAQAGPGPDALGSDVLGPDVTPPDGPPGVGMNVSALAIQPQQVLLPEGCGVALRMTARDREWVAVWRPQQRELQHLAAPPGWLPEGTRWTAAGELLLPCSTAWTPCGLARLKVPVPAPRPLRPGTPTLPGRATREPAPAPQPVTTSPPPAPAVREESTGLCKPVPLQQAPLARA